MSTFSPNLRIKNQALTVSHYPLTEIRALAQITTAAPSGSTSILVNNINGFSVGLWVLLGNWGEPTAEIIRIHTSTPPSGSTITLNSSTRFDHFADCPVTLLSFNQAEFTYSANKNGSSRTVLGIIDLWPNHLQTDFTDLAHTGGYGFVRFYNSALSTYSPDYSPPVPYAGGNPANSVEKIIYAAMGLTGDSLNDEYCKEGTLIGDTDECQRHISQMRDWSFELQSDESLVTINGENAYSLADFDFPLKYGDTKQSFVSFLIQNRPIYYRSLYEIQQYYAFSRSSVLTADATIGATSVTIANSNGFASTGTVYLRENGFVAYTANDVTTGILSGIDPASIATLVPSGATVWQDINPTVPYFFTFYDGSILLAGIPNAQSTGQPLRINYLKQLDALTNFSDVTPVTFYETMKHYVAYKILLRKKSYDEAQKHLDIFNAFVKQASSSNEFRTITAQQVYVLGGTAKRLCDTQPMGNNFNP